VADIAHSADAADFGQATPGPSACPDPLRGVPIMLSLSLDEFLGVFLVLGGALPRKFDFNHGSSLFFWAMRLPPWVSHLVLRFSTLFALSLGSLVAASLPLTTITLSGQLASSASNASRSTLFFSSYIYFIRHSLCTRHRVASIYSVLQFHCLYTRR
jgi:hypothetical protein